MRAGCIKNTIPLPPLLESKTMKQAETTPQIVIYAPEEGVRNRMKFQLLMTVLAGVMTGIVFILGLFWAIEVIIHRL